MCALHAAKKLVKTTTLPKLQVSTTLRNKTFLAWKSTADFQGIAQMSVLSNPLGYTTEECYFPSMKRGDEFFSCFQEKGSGPGIPPLEACQGLLQKYRE